MATHLLRHAPRRLVSAAAGWPVASQQRARRNALVASTALSERRREVLDVEEFLARHNRPVEGATTEPGSSPEGRTG